MPSPTGFGPPPPINFSVQSFTIIFEAGRPCQAVALLGLGRTFGFGRLLSSFSSSVDATRHLLHTGRWLRSCPHLRLLLVEWQPLRLQSGVTAHYAHAPEHVCASLARTLVSPCASPHTLPRAVLHRLLATPDTSLVCVLSLVCHVLSQLGGWVEIANSAAPREHADLT